ncbi:Splicing factor U2af subunit [Amphibalanus amphitrite]|uniref:Splicing factor U2af subunit n=1 Tax=Amphibalanus amphitrite TaxID=1232801 RepID=A0A6A4VGN5_AMPAM|nr:Splicing factor U2af subunit [Amphibalanus amphitrite]
MASDCSRLHNKPTFSQTIVLQKPVREPAELCQVGPTAGHLANVSDEEMQEHFDNFFEDVFVECETKYGEIEEMNVCDNLGDHLVGNVYIKFRREEDAEKAVEDLKNRWFGGRPIPRRAQPRHRLPRGLLSAVRSRCTRSGFCNFMHLKPISRELRKELYGRRGPAYVGGGRRRSRSRDRDFGRGGRGYGRGGYGGGGGGRYRRSRSRERRRSRSRERRDRSREREGRAGRY